MILSLGSKFLLCIAAYIVADILSAFYHVFTDKGWNIQSQLNQFRNHHERPETMTFDWEPLLAGVPFFIIGWCLNSFFLMATGIFLSLAQVPHYYTHHAAPWFIRVLQKTNIILRVETHNNHHTSPFDKDYAVLCGWNNFWINKVAQYIPTRK